MGDTATTVRHYHQYTKPLIPDVSRGNELHNTNSPRASLQTGVSSYSHTYILLAMTTIQGQRLFCSVVLILWLLFKGSVYSKKYVYASVKNSPTYVYNWVSSLPIYGFYMNILIQHYMVTYYHCCLQ